PGEGVPETVRGAENRELLARGERECQGDEPREQRGDDAERERPQRDAEGDLRTDRVPAPNQTAATARHLQPASTGPNGRRDGRHNLPMPIRYTNVVVFRAV